MTISASAAENGCKRRLAVTLRLRALIQVFEARRLAELFLYRVIADRRNVATRMRLNTEWGCNLLKFERALQDLLGELDGGVARQDRMIPHVRSPVSQ